MIILFQYFMREAWLDGSSGDGREELVEESGGGGGGWEEKIETGGGQGGQLSTLFGPGYKKFTVAIVELARTGGQR